MGGLLQDVRFGMRRLAKSPGFTLLAALTLALGIGANAAIFSVINPILIEPLPYPEPDRLTMIWTTFEGARSQIAFHTFREIAARTHSFESLAILEPWQATMTSAREPERLDGQNVSADYFRVLGIRPMFGRDFERGDDAFHGPKIAILSYALWKRRFGTDRGVVGRLVKLDGDAFTVIGVMPESFENVMAPNAEIWSPTQYDPSHIGIPETGEWGNHLRLIGRTRPGVNFEQAKDDLATIASNPVEEFPRVKWASLRTGFILDSMKGDVTRGVRPALLAVFGAVVLVLLVTCVNVTNRALVVAEVALALVLLVSAGLLLRSVSRLLSVDPGFEAARVLTMQVQTAGHQFDDSAATQRFFERALENVRRVPGVESAAFTSILPLTDDSQFGEYGTHFEKDGSGYNTYRYVVTPEYFETMRIALKYGRYLDAGDGAGKPQAVVISESLAKKEFATAGDAIGQLVHVGPMDRPWYTVVGVVRDVKQVSLAAGLTDAVYITSEQSWFADSAETLVVRTQGKTERLLPEIQKAIWAVDKDQPIVRISSMETVVALSAAQRHFVLVLFDAFGLVALALAGIGIYGVLSGSVGERTREIGLRVALGAQRSHVLGLIFRQGMKLVVLGAGVGLMGAMLAGEAIRSLLYGVSALDVVTYLGVLALLTGVAGVACWIPAQRAVRLDPMAALRHE